VTASILDSVNIEVHFLILSILRCIVTASIPDIVNIEVHCDCLYS